MEAALGRSSHGVVVKEERRPETSSGDGEACRDEAFVKADNNTKFSSRKSEDLNCSSVQLPAISKMERSSTEPDSGAYSSSPKDQDDHELESAKAQMGEVREENQRLRLYLDQIMKDYKTLQMQLYDIVQQEAKESTGKSSISQIEEPEFVSLSLGRVSGEAKKDEKNKTASKEKENEGVKGGLSLGLDSKFEVPVLNPSPENSCGGQKDDAGETWPPSKILKTVRTGDDEISQQNPVKRARVSVRARCDTPTMNDGCQWRKYGQKIAKGNPCPRAYYRCTVAPSCPVRKQVQRCAEDMSILITTYEGTHNHPLSYSATAMASTTSAAASMLMSGSTSSQSGSGPLSATSADLHGLNYYLSDGSKSKQFYLPNSSLSAVAVSSNPTITLDLTASSSSSSSSYFNRLSSNYPPPRFPSTSFSFASSESNSLPNSWGNGLLTYGGSTTQPYIRNHAGSLNPGRHSQENFFHPHLQKNNPAPVQQLVADPITAATKAITSDPSFQSALAAALASIMGANGGIQANHGGGSEAFGQKPKWGNEPLAAVSTAYQSTSKGNGCATSFLNKSPSTNAQPGSLMFLPPALPFSTPKNASASHAENREHSS